MEERHGDQLRWDGGRSRWRRRVAAAAEIVATNGSALLVSVALRPDLHIGSRVDIEVGGGRGVAEIRHIAPTGGTDAVALVGIELVKGDEVLTAELARMAAAGSTADDADRWWWQQGR